MNDEDPAKTFFPDQDEPDLYGALSVSETATPDEIKKSYRKLALQFHPDKLTNSASSTEEDKEAANKRFHQISFAYTVLSDEKRRKRFDETGRTDESFFDGEADWNAYFKELWQGEVNGKTLDDFVKSYKGSEEEKEDILAAYTTSEGSLDALFENVMCSNVLDDEERFILLVESAIKTKHVSSFPQWRKDIKDSKGRTKRRENAKNEAKEAEELAKELGVHDKLFGEGGNAQIDEDGTSGNKKTKKASKGKGKANINDEGVDEDALKALIQSRNSKQNSMNSLIERLEAKYGAADGDPFDQKKKASSSSSSKKRSKKDDDGDDKKTSSKKNAEPTEEEFEALQKKLFGGGKKKKEKTVIEDDEEEEVEEPKSKKLRRSKKA